MTAVARGIRHPTIDFGFAPASTIDTDPQLRRECSLSDFAIDGRAGQAGPVEDSSEADDTVWVRHGLSSIH